MPIPNFVPIVGRDFSDVGNQLYSWANFNRGIEENNIARLGQRDQNLNSFFDRQAALRRDAETQGLNLQLGERERADRLAAQAEANRFARYQFGVRQKQAEADRLARADEFQKQLALESRQQLDDTAAKRAEQVYNFASFGAAPAELPKELTAGLTPEQMATANVYTGLAKKQAQETAAANQTKLQFANNVIRAKRIEKGFKQWLETPQGKAILKQNREAIMPSQQRALYLQSLASPDDLPELDEIEMAEVAAKNRFDRLNISDAPLDGNTDTFTFGQPAKTPAPTSTATVTSPAPREVIRVDKNGRRVVFDAITLKPLRYAD